MHGTMNLKKKLDKNVEKIILKIWVQCVPSSVNVGGFLLRNPRVKVDILKT
jgi:hypothetical protein